MAGRKKRVIDSRIRERRKKAERETLIEQMTVEEMEAELRRRHRQDGGEEKRE